MMGPMMPEIEAELNRLYQVHRAFDPTHAGALAAAQGRIRAVVTGGDIGLPAEWFERLPKLGLIAVNGVGTDQIDLERAKAHHIHVTTTPGVLANDVADIAVGLILAVLRQFSAGDRLVRSGGWASGEKLPLGRSLRGRRLGVLGLGQIGRAVGERGRAFGMQIAYYNRSDVDAPGDWTRCPTPRALADHCDVLAVCIAATAATRNLVDRELLDALGPEGVLINIARGSIVDEDALIAALESGRIAGAGLDVFQDEPAIRADFRRLDNVALMPHQGSATIETRRAMGEMVLANLEAFFAGRKPPTDILDSAG